jgi:hypothetical protein
MWMSPREHCLEHLVWGYLVVEWAPLFLDYKKKVMKLSDLAEKVEEDGSVIVILQKEA